MIAIKLSMEEVLIKWAEFCVDWFMNLFADPEYYWVEETYPGKNVSTNNEVVHESGTKTKIVLAIKAIKEAIDRVQGITAHTGNTFHLVPSTLRVKWNVPKVFALKNSWLKYTVINI
ncbi:MULTISPECIES: hypothetical protein [unclassified Saccharicrinis]|uniref:hypothetical protein n=1 Tax=unclassified Saccharicrinis TaxID=2646859 RepID=UPI003D34579C